MKHPSQQPARMLIHLLFFHVNHNAINPTMLCTQAFCPVPDLIWLTATLWCLNIEQKLLLWCALLGTALNATQLLLVSRLNVLIGLSDKLFVLGDYAMLSTLGEVCRVSILYIITHLSQIQCNTWNQVLIDVLNIWPSIRAVCILASLSCWYIQSWKRLRFQVCQWFQNASCFTEGVTGQT